MALSRPQIHSRRPRATSAAGICIQNRGLSRQLFWFCAAKTEIWCFFLCSVFFVFCCSFQFFFLKKWRCFFVFLRTLWWWLWWERKDRRQGGKHVNPYTPPNSRSPAPAAMINLRELGLRPLILGMRQLSQLSVWTRSAWLHDNRDFARGDPPKLALV